MQKLNPRGFTHGIALMVFMSVFAITGVGYLVASHADNCPIVTSYYNGWQYRHRQCSKPLPAPAPAPTPAPTPAPGGTPGQLPMYLGLHQAGYQNITDVNKLETDASKKASIIMFYQAWGLTGSAQDFQTAWMNQIRANGSIPMETWEPWDYTAGVNQPGYSLSSIATGKYDTYITKFALAAKAWNHPFFLRFAHEMNGRWYPWDEQANGNKPGQYVTAWQHVHNIFTANGANNVTWVWSPNVEYPGSTPMSQLYPGDSQVDWIALDGYNWGTTNGYGWQTFTSVFGSSYNTITAITNKPLLVAETAASEQGGNKAQWITNSLTKEIFTFPRIRGFIWFNENKEADWRIESSNAALNAFKAAVGTSSYATNSYGNISTTPIP